MSTTKASTLSAPTEIDDLILSCFCDVSDADEDIKIGSWKDVGKRISIEARVYFSSSGSSCDNKANVKDSLSAISLLIQRLGSDSLINDSSKTSQSSVCKQRILSLNVLTGALLGCTDLLLSTFHCKDVDESNIQPSIKFLIERIGNFVLLYCAPMQSNENEEAWTQDEIINQDRTRQGDANGLNGVSQCRDEDLRDAAMDCTCALLKLPWIPLTKDNDSLNNQLESMIHTRIQIARQAVQYRCSTIHYTEQSSMENGYHVHGGYEDMFEDEESDHSNKGDVNTTLSGLSLLVRARRSLCFSVLQNAIDGIHNDLETYRTLQTLSSSETNVSAFMLHPNRTTILSRPVLEEIASFISFICTCLLGETDPRCLMQMMTLLHQCQCSFHHLFTPLVIQNNYSSVHLSSTIQFPTGEMFDSVAPYYPIQFTPPPNNIHGISRESLHGALMSVLCYFDYSYYGSSVEDTMTNLTTRLFLERISSTADDSTNISHDDREAANESIQGLNDLTKNLFVASDVASDTNLDETALLQYTRCFFLSEENLSALTSTLISCHKKACMFHNLKIQTEESDMDPNRMLADLCRDAVSRIAYDIDFNYQSNRSSKQASSITDKLKCQWRVFISDPIMSCTSTISSSLQSIEGRIALAYLTSLAVCGGLETLRMVLSNCIPVLIRILSSFENMNQGQVTFDHELMSTAAFGMATLFSASKKTLEKIEKNGLSVHPHPLETYFLEVTLVLCRLATIAFDFSSLSSIQVAAIKAIERIFLCTPNNLMGPVATSSIQRMLVHLTDKVLNESEMGDNVELQNAISHLLGTAIGKSFPFSTASTTVEVFQRKGNDECCVFDDQEMAIYVQTKVLSMIMPACMRKETINSSLLRNILSDACSVGSGSASIAIICPIFDALRLLLQEHITNDSSNDNTDEYIMSLVILLSHIIERGGEVSRLAFRSLSHPHSTIFDLMDLIALPTADSDPGMSALFLPSKRNNLRLIVDKRIYLASRMTSYILSAYLNAAPSYDLDQLVSYLSRIIPPLTEWDNIKLSCIIPILATSLIHCGIERVSTLNEILPYLLEYCLNTDNITQTRTYAALLAFAIIERQEDQDMCPARKILVELLLPFATKACETRLGRVNNAFDELADVIHLISVMGTASAARGHASLQTADEVSLFLAGLSCRKQIPASPFNESYDTILRTLGSIETDGPIAAASAYGTLLSWENERCTSTMTKQRLVCRTLPVILSACGANVPEHFLCPLTILAHIACNVPMKAFTQAQVDHILSLIIRGVGTLSDLKVSHEEKINFIIVSQQKTDLAPMEQLILCAILKITIESESLILNFNPKVISSLLLYCATCSTDVQHTPNIIIALQLLMNIIHLQQEKPNSYCKALNNTVLLHLSSLIYHPSFHVRQASAQVRNVWALL